jgi:hypothetical protein
MATIVIAITLLAACATRADTKKKMSPSIAACTQSPVSEIPVREVNVGEFPEVGCISVENGYDDFSSCARDIFSTSEGSNNTGEAAQTLHSCLAANQNVGMLIGHGDPGAIRTGNGDSIPAPNQIISGPRTDWEQDLAELQGIKQLTLFSCQTGANQAGQSLVENLSQALHATVRAQNSIVFCSKERRRLYLHNDQLVHWITASPGQAAAPLPAQAVDPTVSGSCLRVVTDDNGGCEEFHSKAAVQITNISSAAIPDGSIATSLSKHNPGFVDTTPLLQDFVQNGIDFCNPIRAVADASPTGMMTVELNGKEKKFVILGDTLLQDPDHPGVLYWMNRRGFQQLEIAIQAHLR